MWTGLKKQDLSADSESLSLHLFYVGNLKNFLDISHASLQAPWAPESSATSSVVPLQTDIFHPPTMTNWLDLGPLASFSYTCPDHSPWPALRCGPQISCHKPGESRASCTWVQSHYGDGIWLAKQLYETVQNVFLRWTLINGAGDGKIISHISSKWPI